MFSRFLNFSPLLEHRSIFLFGPRRTGKSTYLRTTFPNAVYYDLLDGRVFRDLSASPELIRQRLHPNDTLVIIDEVQKLPQLLDEVHKMIEERKNLRFILTGSSLRKLRRGGANLLAGRALTVHFFPLVYPEIPAVALEQRLLRGNLPAMTTSAIPGEDLKAYVGDYIREEIQGEFESRKLEGFSRFLNFAATCSGQQVNYTALGQELGINPKTVREYFQVLDDTLLGTELPAFTKGSKRKPVTTAKFYFFDIGITNTLMNRSFTEVSEDMIGSGLEHLVFHELRSYLSYKRLDIPLHYWRTQSQIEVDFLLGDEIAVEVKASARVSRKDMRGLEALSEEISLKRRILVCREQFSRVADNGIEILPIEIFFEELWAGRIL